MEGTKGCVWVCVCVHAEGEKRFVLEADIESLTGTDEHMPVVSAL